MREQTKNDLALLVLAVKLIIAACFLLTWLTVSAAGLYEVWDMGTQGWADCRLIFNGNEYEEEFWCGYNRCYRIMSFTNYREGPPFNEPTGIVEGRRTECSNGFTTVLQYGT